MAAAADLALSGLTKTYGCTVAVDDVTLRIGAGEMVSLLGPSGCGKTTTLRMIAGLIAPTRGEIYIGGAPMASVPVHRRNIGMLFQNYALFPHLSVGGNVAFGLDMRRIGRAETTRRVREALALVQLGALEDRLPAELSGGQQQRVALARALVIEPSVLLLDEPLGALDKGLRENMQVELRELQRRLGVTGVIVTHDQEEALTLSDRIVVMRGGRLEQVGTPQEVYARPVSRFVAGFLGASNFLGGRVVERAAGSVTVELPTGSRLPVPHDGAAVTTGQAVDVAVRPEAIAVRPADLAGPDGLPATVAQVIYRGAVTHVFLTLGDGSELVAHQQNRTGGVPPPALQRGLPVVAHWATEGNHLLATPA